MRKVNRAKVRLNGGVYCTGHHGECRYAKFVHGGEFCIEENEHSALCMNVDATRDAQARADRLRKAVR